MLIRMKTKSGMSLEQIQAFMEGNEGVEWSAPERSEIYGWTKQILIEHEYHLLGREGKGLIRCLIAKVTGRSRAQSTRMIGQYLATGEVGSSRGKGRLFKGKYTGGDIALLAKVDQAHGQMSGPATRAILMRGYYEFGDVEYERLSEISSAHIYNLRQSKGYREQRQVQEKTRAVGVAIGERRKPNPRGLPGYLRIDTVHQGDRDGIKGVYHINAVDEVTQWQVVVAVPRIAEVWVKPALEWLLAQFPFIIRGFHSDNGSEYINRMVEKLLRSLGIEQTKSRAGHCGDNGLAEARNGAVVRKQMGYEYIAGEEAERVSGFYREYLNPYLNFHRPCAVPEIETDSKGKKRRRYRWYATPWEILRQLPRRCLRDGVTMQELERQAGRESDTQAAVRMRAARELLFAEIDERREA